MIKRFRVQNYKALRDVTLELTPIHVLIGPNDSGKTSILEAVAALCRSVDYPLDQAFMGSWDERELVWQGQLDAAITFEAMLANNQDSCIYYLSCRFKSPGRRIIVEEEYLVAFPKSAPYKLKGYASGMLSGINNVHDDTTLLDYKELIRLIYNSLTSIHYYYWNPRLLALPVAPDYKRRFRMEPSGFGLALCLDDILGYDRDKFINLEKRFREIFPQIRSIKLIPEPAYRVPADNPEQVPLLERADGKGIYFELTTGGELVPASQASDGMLLVLAYLAILNLPKPPRVVLVEEPENGIHPKRLRDVLTIMRNLVEEQSHSQVILTTHSPYALDLFQPEEVTLCQKEKDGSVSVHRLSESPLVRDQIKIFTLGEIWTGEGEEAIIQASSADETAES